MSPPRKLRLAFLLHSFPELSNTFVIDQITGMIARGHQVDLFAVSPKSFTGLPAGLEHFNLEHRMRHLAVPSNRIARFASAARLLLGPKGLNRAHIDSLNPWTLGKRSLSLVQLHTAASFLRSGPYDVLHTHFGQHGITADRLRRSGAVDAALVTSFRGADLSSHYPKYPHRFGGLFKNGDLHLPVSAEFERRLVAAGVPRDRVVVHHDGIDLQRFPFVERRPVTGAAKLLFVGRLVEKKGLAYALDALHLLARSGRDVHFAIIGDGPLALSLRARTEALGLSEYVSFLGALSSAQVSQIMQESHILLAPSVTATTGDQEGIPTVLKEAMATGMPVVSTFHTGIPELVEHQKTGLLSPEHDVKKLAENLRTLLENPKHWIDMGRAGRRKVQEEFDTERLNDALVDRYYEAMETRSLTRNRNS